MYPLFVDFINITLSSFFAHIFIIFVIIVIIFFRHLQSLLDYQEDKVEEVFGLNFQV